MIIALVIIGIIIILMGFMYAIVHGQNITTNITQMNLDCVRMFYSDTWDKGYVQDLAEFCAKS